MCRASSLVWINVQFSSEFSMAYVGHASYMVPSLYTDSMRIPLPFIFIALYLLYTVGIVMTVIFMPPCRLLSPTLLLLPFPFPASPLFYFHVPLTLFCNDPVRFSRIAYKEWMKGGFAGDCAPYQWVHHWSNLTTINGVQTPRQGWGLESYSPRLSVLSFQTTSVC